LPGTFGITYLLTDSLKKANICRLR